MRIQYVNVGIIDDETDEEYEVTLLYDSGDDTWPDEVLPSDLEQKILHISQIAYE